MKKTISLATSLLLMASCQSYKEMELAPDPILQELEAQRAQILSPEFSFTQAAQVMEKNNLQLKQLKSNYKNLQKVADLKTPWPNPEITAGPAFSSDSGISNTGSAYPFIGIGFSIPLGPRLRRNDDLNRLRALESFNEQVLAHRQLYFKLKQAWVDFALNQSLKKSQEEISRTLELTAKTAKQLLEVGTATRLGVNGIKIRQAELRLKKIDQLIRSREALAQLSELLVVDAEQFSKLQVAELVPADHAFSLKELKQKLIKNNPNLARTEMSFHKADAQLRLELARQYPDLKVGFDFEEEVNDDTNTLSFPFSIELPLFDRNQQAIQASLGQRESALSSYRQELNQKLSQLSMLNRQHELAKQKLEHVQQVLLPLSRMQLKDARQSLEIGSINILRYLDLLTDSLQVELQARELHRESWHYFTQLQKLIGLPLQSSDSSSFPSSSTLSIEVTK